MTAEEALAVAQRHREDGLYWLADANGAGLDRQRATSAMIATAHFSAATAALAISAVEHALQQDDGGEPK